MTNIRNGIYYHFKPVIPRSLQLWVRRRIVQFQAARHSDIWPIDEAAGQPPEGWTKWPGGKKFALVLTHDVDTAKGCAQCLELAGMEENLGFRSSFNFVPLRYTVPPEKRLALEKRDFEVGVHGLYHDGKYYSSKNKFLARARLINRYIGEWRCSGYRAPCMAPKLDWFHELNIEYDASTFDTDPFEPDPAGGVSTIFPFIVSCKKTRSFYVELPYTMPQDFTLFVLMQMKNTDIWKKKLDWVASRNGVVMINSHPDYMNFNGRRCADEEYPAAYYEDFLKYIQSNFGGQYWHVLPRDLARHWVREFKPGLKQ